MTPCTLRIDRLATTLFLLAFLSGTVFAQTGKTVVSANPAPIESARIYRNPEERREAGLGREITEWLTVSGLLELEDGRIENKFSNGVETTRRPGFVTTVQLGLEFTFSETVSGTVILEAEDDGIELHTDVDEAVITAELGDWEIEFGLLNLPFGEYYSHFVTGPILEIAETRSTGLVIDYSLTDSLDLSGFIFDSGVAQNGQNDIFDWGIGIEYASEDESVKIGVGFLSDLAESDEELLKDENNTFQRRVPAWNAYALLGWEKFEITAEMVLAGKSFTELDPDIDRPSAYNLELAYFPKSSAQFAFRIEYSNEVEDAPEWQFGVSTTWRPTKNLTLALDYLYGIFKPGFVVDDDDNQLNKSQMIMWQAGLEF